MEWSAKHNRYIDPTNPPSSQSHTWGPRGSGGRIVLFVAIFAVLQFGWQTLRGTSLEYGVIHHGTVRPAAFLINLVTPDVTARAVQFSVKAPGGGINVLNGCEGLEAVFLLVAAFACAPLSVRQKLQGFALGVVVVFAINQARILGLFYAYRYDHTLFYPLHATVAPILVILSVAGFFYWWLARDRRLRASV